MFYIRIQNYKNSNVIYMCLTLYIHNDYFKCIQYNVCPYSVSLALIVMEPTEYIFMPHEHRLVNLSLSEPASLFTGKEHFHCNLFSSPATKPHFSIPPLPDLTYHLNLFGNGALDLWIDIGQLHNWTTKYHNSKYFTFPNQQNKLQNHLSRVLTPSDHCIYEVFRLLENDFQNKTIQDKTIQETKQKTLLGTVS